jgi:hypothetical protein
MVPFQEAGSAVRSQGFLSPQAYTSLDFFFESVGFSAAHHVPLAVLREDFGNMHALSDVPLLIYS